MLAKRHKEIEIVNVKPSSYIKILFSVLTSMTWSRCFYTKWAKPIRKLGLGEWSVALGYSWCLAAACERVGRELSRAIGSALKGDRMTMSKGLFHPCRH